MNFSKSTVNKLPQNCWDCPNTDCKLPFSKIMPGRKLMDYSYKRHPKCDLKVSTEETGEK